MDSRRTCDGRPLHSDQYSATCCAPNGHFCDELAARRRGCAPETLAGDIVLIAQIHIEVEPAEPIPGTAKFSLIGRSIPASACIRVDFPMTAPAHGLTLTLALSEGDPPSAARTSGCRSDPPRAGRIGDSTGAANDQGIVAATLPVSRVVVAGLEKNDRTVRDSIHQPVFLCNAARPASRQGVPERFRFSGTVEWISEDRVRQVQHADRDVPLAPDPVPEILRNSG